MADPEKELPVAFAITGNVEKINVQLKPFNYGNGC